MAKTRAIQNATQAQTAKPQRTIKDYVEQMQTEIARALPTAITPERFTRMVLSAISTNPQLAQCTKESFLGAMMLAAQLGLEPNTPLGQAYLIPYRNSKKGIVECQFQVGYKGLIDLAYRSGQIKVIQAQVVYANDHFSYAFGLDPQLEHRPAMSDRGEPTHVYAIFHTTGDGYGFQVMSIADIQAHAKKYSQSYSSSHSPWRTNFEEMAKKTVLKATLKYAPLKSEFVRGVYADEATVRTIEPNMADNPSVLDQDFEGEIIDVTPEADEGNEPLPFEGEPGPGWLHQDGPEEAGDEDQQPLGGRRGK